MRFWDRLVTELQGVRRRTLQHTRSQPDNSVWGQRALFSDLTQETKDSDSGTTFPEMHLDPITPVDYKPGAQGITDKRVGDDVRLIRSLVSESLPTHTHLVPSQGGQLQPGAISPQGSGSGLDADLLDGQHAAAFAAASHTHPLSDLEQSGATNGQVATWNNTSGEWEPQTPGAGGASALDDLSDVTITGPTNLDLLQYDNGTSMWVDRTLAEAGVSAVGHTHTESEITDLNHYDSTDFATDFAAADLANIGAADHSDLNLDDGANPHGTNVGDLDDVTITGPTDGDVLQQASGAWVDRSLSEAGISAVGHTHAASDIVSGLLPLARGGMNANLLGVTSLHLLRINSGVTAVEDAGVAVSDLALAGHEHTVNRTCKAEVESPSVGLAVMVDYVPVAATIVRVVGVTDTGTVDFNIEKRDKLTPDVAGTDLDASEFTATASGIDDTGSFTSASTAGSQWYFLTISAIASTPTKLWVAVEYQIAV